MRSAGRCSDHDVRDQAAEVFLLHDIGKLTVSNQILDKRGSLGKPEWATVRGHTFHTSRIPEVISGFDEVTCRTVDHHEALGCTGYPSTRSRMICRRIAHPRGRGHLHRSDRGRSSRAGTRDEVARFLNRSVAKAAIDPAITTGLLDNYKTANERRAAGQSPQVDDSAAAF